MARRIPPRGERNTACCAAPPIGARVRKALVSPVFFPCYTGRGVPLIGGKLFRHVRGAQPCARPCRSAGYRGPSRPWRSLHHRCVGCETQGRPGRSGRPSLLHQRSGNRRRRSRRRGAATAIEWRSLRREPQAVVRSTLPEAEAVVPALVRALLHGAVRSEVRARSAGAPARVLELPRFGGQVRAVATSTEVSDSRWKQVSIEDRC